MEEITELLRLYSDKKDDIMFIVITPDGDGWVENKDQDIYLEFKDINDLKYQLENNIYMKE